MKIIESITEMQRISNALHQEGKSISLVPTMGYLHSGHLSLIKRAKELSDIVVTSLFVNPTQFAPNEDFAKYPRDFQRDTKLAEESGSDYLFHPHNADMYPKEFSTFVSMAGITKKFEGATRPNHFNGVATIVAKLFNIIMPDIAVFGQKDYQQTLVIKQLVRDFNFDISIVIAPTMREPDGIAMSSRNIYLSPQERSEATILYKTLENAIQSIESGEKRRKMINAIMHNSLRSVPAIKLDYACSADSLTFDEPEEFVPGQQIVLLIAVFIGRTRLIDNALVTIPSAISSMPNNFIEGITEI
jgi:pantoate--beta-alanine ligase